MSKSTISTFELFQMFPDAEAARVYMEGKRWPCRKEGGSLGCFSVWGRSHNPLRPRSYPLPTGWDNLMDRALWDEYARQAFISGIWRQEDRDLPMQTVAERCFNMADVMMSERDKRIETHLSAAPGYASPLKQAQLASKDEFLIKKIADALRVKVREGEMTRESVVRFVFESWENVCAGTF